MLEQALRTFLLSKSQISAMLGTKLHVGDFVPVVQDDIPALGIEGELAGALQSMDGSLSDLAFATFTLRAKCRLFTDSVQLIDWVVAALQGVPLGMNVDTTVDGAPITVRIVQVDLLSVPYNEEEIDYGRGFTIKPRALKIRIGWRPPVTTI